MGNGNHRTLVLLQMLLQPVDTLSIEMVGRLVEQQHIGFLKQQATECHTTAFASRQILHAPVTRGTVQGSHRTIELGVHVPSIGSVDDILQLSLTLHQLVHLVRVFVIFGQTEFHVDIVVFCQRIIDMLHALHHILLDSLLLIERRFLRQIAHAVAWAPHHITLILLVQSGNDFHQCGLTRTVQTDDTNLGTIEKTEVDILEYLFLILLNGLAYAYH